MMNQRKRIALVETLRGFLRQCARLAILGIPILGAGCKPYTVVKLNQDNPGGDGVKVYFENTRFNADEYVGKIWQSKVIPYFEEKAHPAVDVLAERQKDFDVAGEKFGTRSSSEGIPWNFIIKGKGKILGVNTESIAGTLDVDLLPYDGTPDVKLQIGPVFKGTSIRDSLSFISFDEFENQIEFARLSNAFNKKVHEFTLGNMDFTKAVGKEIEFKGAFTEDGTDEIVVTPVQFAVL